MICRVAVACALLSSILFVAPTAAQPGGRQLSMKARVLDILFPLDVEPAPYFAKIVLRFSDSGTQLVVVTYPGGKSELISYSILGMNSGQLSRRIFEMVAENPEMEVHEIAARMKVEISRSPIDREALTHVLDELRAIRLSPVLASRVAVDEYSEYEFWYDTWQESVHYTITSPPGNAPQLKLIEWMDRFRARVPDLLKCGSPSK